MPTLPDKMLEHCGPMTLSGGLRHAIRFAELLDAALDGRALNITVSGVREGLFFYDHVRDRAIFVTMNKITSCGRMYLGASGDFAFESKAPRAWLRAREWQSDELPAIVNQAVAFMTVETTHAQPEA